MLVLKIAVTGGLSSGKSSVCRFLKEFGAFVVSTDEIVHRLLSFHSNLGHRIVGLLGKEIVINNQLDRSQIAKKVFSDPKLLQSLENLLHPAVQDEVEKLYHDALLKNPDSLFVVEIPLLFETGSDRFYDFRVAVIAPEFEAVKRFMAATGYNSEEFARRMSRQLSLEEKAKKADYVIQNDGDFEKLRNATEALFHKLSAKK